MAASTRASTRVAFNCVCLAEAKFRILADRALEFDEAASDCPFGLGAIVERNEDGRAKVGEIAFCSEGAGSKGLRLVPNKGGFVCPAWSLTAVAPKSRGRGLGRTDASGSGRG